MRSLSLAAYLACAAFPAAAATYTFADVELPSSSLATSFPSTTITIADTAVQRGHFFVFARTGPVMIGGDVADFVSFASNGIVIDRTAAAPYYSLLIDLSFNADGSVAAGRVTYSGISPTIDLTGSGNRMTGLYTPTDNTVCGSSVDCRVLDARLVAVPAPDAPGVSVDEPGTMAIIGFGALGLAISRWRRRLLSLA